MGYTFISYSRRQLYFAESIAIHLQKMGLDIWFDLQQLHAGVDWSTTLKRGYENCDRLVLVTSPAALASRYVEDEWKSALKNDREVILAVVADVEIPAALQDKPIFDFRENFDLKISQLGEYLRGNGQARFDEVALPRFFLSTLPRDIRLIFWAYTLPIFWTILTTSVAAGRLNRSGDHTGTYFVLAGVGVSVLWLLLPRVLLTHDMSEDSMQGGLQGSCILQTMIGFFAGGMIFLEWLHGPGIASIVYAGAILSIAFNLYVWSRPKSADWLRWLPPGRASRELRHRFHGELLRELSSDEVELVSRPIHYSFTCDPGDWPLAGYAVQHISAAGNSLVSMEEAEKHLFLITNRTSRRTLEEFGSQYGARAIYLLGTSLSRSDSLTDAYRTQLVDIRDQDPARLIALGGLLGNLESWRRLTALEATPTSFQTLEMPIIWKAYAPLGGLQSVMLLTGAFTGSLIERLFFAAVGFATYAIVEASYSRRISLVYALVLYAAFTVMAILKNLGWHSLILTIIMIINVIIMLHQRYWYPLPEPVARDAIGFKFYPLGHWLEIALMIVLAAIVNFLFPDLVSW